MFNVGYLLLSRSNLRGDEDVCMSAKLMVHTTQGWFAVEDAEIGRGLYIDGVYRGVILSISLA